jgi:hypothetical protein
MTIRTASAYLNSWRKTLNRYGCVNSEEVSYHIGMILSMVSQRITGIGEAPDLHRRLLSSDTGEEEVGPAVHACAKESGELVGK